jgi:phytanoyl-CoA hydroxylase
MTAARHEYDDQGYTIFRNVLDQDLIREAGDHVEWLQKKHPELRPEMLGHTLVPDDPFWVRLISDDRLLDIVEQFIGPNIALFASHYICKAPFSGQPVLWHQDGSYWPLDPMEVVTLWLAVDDSDSENGCMRVIPGTHKLALQEHKQNDQVESVLGTEIPVDFVDESLAVDFVLKKGDVSVHNPQIVHGSNANTSPRRRCGLTIRYIPTTTKLLEPDKGCLFHLRGDAPAGINSYLKRPVYRPGDHFPFRGAEQLTSV